MRYNYFLIDGNNLWWRSWYNNANDVIQKKKNATYNGGIEQFLKSVNILRDRFGYVNNTKLYFLFDNTVSTLELRKIISEGEYKSHRLTKKSQDILYKDLEYLIEILKCYDSDFRVVRKEKCEADDLVQPILNNLSLNKNTSCLLVSVDMDWSRSTSDYIHWFNYKEVYGRSFFTKKYGFDPKGKSVQLYKAIRGDSSDKIKVGIPNLPIDIVIDIVNNFKDVNDLMNNLWETEYPEKWKYKIKEYEGNLRKNYELVDFIDIEDDIKNYIYVCKENTKKLEILYKAKNIPLESRMISHKKKKSNFLKRINV